MMRYQKRDIPNNPHRCTKIECVYNGHNTLSGICTEPRTNNGNGDAKCFFYSNVAVIKMLIPLVGEDNLTPTAK